MSVMHHGDGIIADFENPQPDEICIPTIIDNIGRTHRFGNRKDALTTLQHSRLCRALAMAMKEPHVVIKAVWRHDWHEGVFGVDIPAPFKQAISKRTDIIKVLERRYDRAIFAADNIPFPPSWVWRRVRHYDLLSRRIEMEKLGMTPDANLPEVPSEIDVESCWAIAVAARDQ